MTTMTTKKRANGKHSGHWISKQRRLAIYLRDNFTCAYCLKNLHDADPRDITLDHLVCRVDGGNHSETNLITACHRCNSRRADLPLSVFAGVETRKMIRRNTKRSLRRYLALARALLTGQTGSAIN